MRELPPPVARIGEALAAGAGGYLRNTVYEPGATCEVCATPVDGGYGTCYQCGQHRRSGQLIANRVATIVYAVEHSPSVPRDQTYVAMYGYKAPTPQGAHVQLVRSLAAVGLAGHWACLTKISGLPVTRWTTVPGTRHATIEHPLHALIAPMFRDPRQEVRIRHRPGATKTRGLRPDHLEVRESLTPDTHVVVVDDSWVTGGSAQSVAIALREAGAAEVSILALTRVLSPGWGPTAEFLRSPQMRRDFDYTVCPWTAGACP